MQEGRQLLREITPHGETTKVSLLDMPITGFPSITELSEKITLSKMVEIVGPTPEFRLTENDQTDPAGRYRILVSGDNFSIGHALTALWATDFKFFTFDHTNSRIDIDATHGTSWGLNLYATNTSIRLLGNNTAASASTSIYGGTTAYLSVYGNGVIQFVSAPALLAGFTSSAQSLMAASTGVPLILRQTENTVSNQAAILSSYRSGTAANNDEGYVSLKVKDSGPTESEFARMTWVALDKTTNSKDGRVDFDVMIADTLTPVIGIGQIIEMNTPNIVPTTANLPAGHTAFVVDAADQLTAYWNKAGAIKSLVIGTLA